MEISLFIALVDILGSAGIGIAYSKEIKKDLRYVAEVGGIVPLILLSIRLFTNISDVPEIFSNELIFFFEGWLLGAVSSLFASLFAEQIKKIFIRIRQ